MLTTLWVSSLQWPLGVNTTAELCLIDEVATTLTDMIPEVPLTRFHSKTFIILRAFLLYYFIWLDTGETAEQQRSSDGSLNQWCSTYTISVVTSDRDNRHMFVTYTLHRNFWKMEIFCVAYFTCRQSADAKHQGALLGEVNQSDHGLFGYHCCYLKKKKKRKENMTRFTGRPQINQPVT